MLSPCLCGFDHPRAAATPLPHVRAPAPAELPARPLLMVCLPVPTGSLGIWGPLEPDPEERKRLGGRPVESRPGPSPLAPDSSGRVGTARLGLTHPGAQRPPVLAPGSKESRAVKERAGPKSAVLLAFDSEALLGESPLLGVALGTETFPS